MRVLVELFDIEPVKNILSLAIYKPELVVYLCDERDTTLFKESSVYRFIKRRGLRTAPRFYYFNAADLASVRRALWAVVRDYPGCVFDFSGGRDLVLLVAGTFTAELDLPGFYIDLPVGHFVDIRHCSKLRGSFCMPEFTVDDLLAMTGAGADGHGHLSPDEVTPEFEKDILQIFPLVLRHPKAWGSFVSYLQICSAGGDMNTLESHGAKTMVGDRETASYNPAIMEQLFEAGIFSHYAISGRSVAFTYKSPLHKRCLLNSGIWLELYCYVAAKNSHWFNEVLPSVVIDWDESLPNGDAAKNEVDVLLIKGVCAVFVSCKMSLPSPLALSEIKLLSVKFGGRMSRAVIVTTARLGAEHRALANRARDMDVMIIDKTDIESGKLTQKLIDAASPF